MFAESVCGDAEGQQEMSLVTAVACSTKPAGQWNRDSNIIFKRGSGSSVYVPSLGHIREASARPWQGHAVNPTDPSDVSRYPWIG